MAAVSFWGVVDVEAAAVRAIEGAFDEWAPRITRGEGQSALRLQTRSRSLSELRLLPPIERTKRVVVAGANYAKHLAADFGLKSHHQPIAFLKAYGALIGAHDEIRYPPLTEELDHEVELVAVIGAEKVDRDDAACERAGLHGRQRRKRPRLAT